MKQEINDRITKLMTLLSQHAGKINNNKKSKKKRLNRKSSKKNL
jgi:hypothetical protein